MAHCPFWSRDSQESLPASVGCDIDMGRRLPLRDSYKKHY